MRVVARVAAAGVGGLGWPFRDLDQRPQLAPGSRSVSQMVRIELSDLERDIVVSAIIEWGGPAMCTDELAVAMGFVDEPDFHVERERLLVAVSGSGELSLRDWARTLVLTEFVFISDIFGSGYEWSLTTGSMTSRRCRRSAGCRGS